MHLHRAKVGDRYVIEQMIKTGSSIGGESSGHIICLDKTTTGDGVVAALQVLAEIKDTAMTLNELRSAMNKYPQRLINVKVNKMIDLEKNTDITTAVNDAEQRLGNEGRVLLRPSGTEPVIRVMVEGTDAALTNQLASDIANVIESVI
jgi:phosphoglucosamine mutase